MEVLALVIAALLIIPLWRVCTRAGFFGALSLLIFLPWFGVLYVGAILLFYSSTASVWIVLFILLASNILFIPTVRRAGFSAWWVALSCIPILGLILLWLFAYIKWPAQSSR